MIPETSDERKPVEVLPVHTEDKYKGSLLESAPVTQHIASKIKPKMISIARIRL